MSDWLKRIVRAWRRRWRHGCDRDYFLIYRHPAGHQPCWHKPTGGLVMPRDDVEHFVVVGMQRYHIGSHEQLTFVRAVEMKWRSLAADLHDRWEREMVDWMRDTCGSD